MRYTYVGIDARQFTYQFIGGLFRVRHIWRVTWKAVNAIIDNPFLRAVDTVVDYGRDTMRIASWGVSFRIIPPRYPSLQR